MAPETGALAAQGLPDTTPPPRILRKAQAYLERGRYSWIWVVPTCPYCGKPHDHDGGPLNGNPSLYLGETFPARCDRANRRALLISDPGVALWYVLTASPHPRSAVQRRGRLGMSLDRVQDALASLPLDQGAAYPHTPLADTAQEEQGVLNAAP
jgi:hypothetical protein